MLTESSGQRTLIAPQAARACRLLGARAARRGWGRLPTLPYEIKSHCFDEEHCAESMELEVSIDEPLAKAWDRDLRRKIISNPSLPVEVAFDPDAAPTGTSPSHG